MTRPPVSIGDHTNILRGFDRRYGPVLADALEKLYGGFDRLAAAVQAVTTTVATTEDDTVATEDVTEVF